MSSSTKKQTLYKSRLERPADPKRPSNNKFLPRTLKIGNQDEAAYQIFRVKRFYIKKVIDPREEDFYITNHSLISKIFKNRKHLKTIKKAHLSTSLKPYVHDSLKHSKNLQDYGFYTDSSTDITDNIVFYLKKLSPKIQSICLEIFKYVDNVNNQDFYNMARSIRRFRKLKHFNRAHDFDTDEDRTHFQRELGIYNQSFSRLKNLKKMTYNISNGEQPCFQRMVRRGNTTYPEITGLKFDLIPRMLPHRENLQPYYEEEDSSDETLRFDVEDLTQDQRKAYKQVYNEIRKQDNEKRDDLRGFKKFLNHIEDNNIEEEEVNSDAGTVASDSMENETTENPALNDFPFVANCIMREEMIPFYRFDLFPNLKKLDILHWDYLYPLDSFVVDGFRALRNLENLKINIHNRSMGTSFIFKGLLELPMLKKFTLRINFLKNKDWKRMKEFLKNQTDLEILNLTVVDPPSTKSRYQWQNSYLEEIIKDLENKPKLKSLELASSFFPLETLSKGLSNLTMKNQLHTFKFSGCDDTLSSDEKFERRVEGLCKFIENQAESLKELGVFLSLALNDKIVNLLGKAISKLTHLKTLEMKFHRSLKNVKEVIIPSLEEAVYDWYSLPPPPEKKLVIPKNWNPKLAKHLKKLKNLESFNLDFGILNPTQEKSAEWFVDVMKVLPSLHKLRKIEIMAYEDGALKPEEQKLFNTLRELKNIKEINIELYCYHGNFTSTFYNLESVKIEIYEKQALRTDLIF